MRAITLNPPASPEEVRKLRRQLPRLPSEYFEFLTRSNGGEGFLGVSPGYFVLWPAESVVRFTHEYELHIYLPGYVCVGSSGGGTLLVFPVPGLPTGLFAVEAIGMAIEDLELVTPSFHEFVAAFGGEWAEGV